MATSLALWDGRLRLDDEARRVCVVCASPVRRAELEERGCWVVAPRAFEAGLLARLPEPCRVLADHEALGLLRGCLPASEQSLSVPRLRALFGHLQARVEGETSERALPGWPAALLEELAERFEQAQEQARAWEVCAARARLGERLDRLPADSLPELLVLEQPATLRAGERALYARLAQRLRLVCVVDPALLEVETSEQLAARPSLDFARPAWRLLQVPWVRHRALDRLHAEAGSLVASLFDGGQHAPLEAPACDVWRPHDLAEEVALCVRLLQRGIVEEVWRAEEVCVAVPDLDRYLPSLRAALAEAGLPCAVPEGEPLSALAPSACLRSLLDWQLSGSGASLLAYLGAYAKRLPRLSVADWAAFAEEYGSLLPDGLGERVLGELRAAGSHSLDPFRLELAAREVHVPGGPDFEQDWLCPFLDSRLWRDAGLVLDLAALWRRWEELEELRSAGADAVEVLFATLREDRCLETGAEDCDGPESRRRRACLERLEEVLTRELPVEAEPGLDALRSLLERVLRRERLPCPAEPGGVRVLSLAESRQLFPGALFCLGLTAEAVRGRAAAWRWLLARHLRQARRLVLSAPKVVDNARQRPATALADLLRWRSAGRLRLGSKPAAAPGMLPFAWTETDHGFPKALLERAFDPAWAPNLRALAARYPEHRALPKSWRDRADAGRRAIAARAAPQLTEFDGVLPEGEREGQAVYSARALEVLVDCPHRWFFAFRLKLGALKEPVEDVPRPELGSLVHRCLEIFWRERLEAGAPPLSSADFDAACRDMLAVAREVLGRSGRDWNRNALVAAERESLILGLDEAGDRGRRGILKAALAFTRDHPTLQGVPWRLEWALGDEPVPITPRVALRLRIDRVDRQLLPGKRQRLVIVDYKTGRGASAARWKSMRSLQLRLYALALDVWFSQEQRAARVAAGEEPDLPLADLRAGELVLGRRERRPADEDFFDPVRGVFREHLALSWFSKAWTLDPGAVEPNLLQTRETVDARDLRVRRGQLWQELEPDACRYCEFARICAHDPATLAGKLRSLPESGRPGRFWTPHRVLAGAAPRGVSALLAAPAEVRAEAPKPPPELSDEQRRAARTDLIATVSAGAGSGKTFVLKTRVLRLLRSGVPVDSLLAITFSEQAAAEIRERIESALGEALDRDALDGTALTAVERARLVRARADMPGAAFSTLHGFCRQLVELAPGLSGWEAVERVAWGPFLERLKDGAIDRVMFRVPEVRPALRRLLREGVNAFRLRRELVRFLEQPHVLASLRAGLDRGDVWWNRAFAKLHAHFGASEVQIALDRGARTLAEDFVGLAARAAEVYVAAKRRARVADFEDLIEGAHRALVRPAAPGAEGEQRTLRKRLRRRFRHILVDEFQDTDTRQWDIVRTLLDGRLDATGDEAVTCFLVGDPKQSIYGWRGGDHRVFLAARRHLEQETGQPGLELSDNYRSGRAVVGFVNQFFGPLFAEDAATAGRDAVPPQPMRARRSAEGSVGVLHVPAEGDSEPLAVAYTCANLLAIAAGRQEPGEMPALAADTPNPKIGILCLTRRDMQAVSQALDAVRVPHLATHRSGYFAQPAVMAVEVAVRAAVDPRDGIALAGLLRGPMFGWSDQELQDLRARLGARWLERLADDLAGRPVAEQLAAWRGALPRLGPAAFVRRVLADRALETAFRWAGRADAARNLRRLLEMIEQAERDGSLGSPVELPGWFGMQQQAEEGAALAPSEHIPVVVMTVHGAKGLEFPVVILPGLRSENRVLYDFITSTLPGDKHTSLAVRASLQETGWRREHGTLGGLLAEQVQRERNAELKRLFYVACTRARDHLLLVWPPSRSRGQERSSTEAQSPYDLMRRRLMPDNPTAARSFFLEGSDLRLPVLFHRPVPHPVAAPPSAPPRASLLATSGLALRPPAPALEARELELLEDCPARFFFAQHLQAWRDEPLREAIAALWRQAGPGALALDSAAARAVWEAAGLEVHGAAEALLEALRQRLGTIEACGLTPSALDGGAVRARALLVARDHDGARTLVALDDPRPAALLLERTEAALQRLIQPVWEQGAWLWRTPVWDAAARRATRRTLDDALRVLAGGRDAALALARTEACGRCPFGGCPARVEPAVGPSTSTAG